VAEPAIVREPGFELPARLIDLGVRDFGEVWGVQREMVAARQRDEVPDTLLFVEHPHVITLGRGSHRENLLAVDDLPVVEIERGGDVTYHGPGQLVAYPIFLLSEEERDLHAYLRRLEETLIRTAGDFGVSAGRNPGWTGAWTTATPPQKLASIGISVKRWVTMHGFALNVTTDLSRFARINPCGLEAGVMASLSSVTGRPIAMDEVKRRVVEHFATVFGRASST
jgi:lipoyl(octanoyl) transferase